MLYETNLRFHSQVSTQQYVAAAPYAMSPLVFESIDLSRIHEIHEKKFAMHAGFLRALKFVLENDEESRYRKLMLSVCTHLEALRRETF